MVRLFTISSILLLSLGVFAKGDSPTSIYIDCPNDVWLYCGDEIWDLSIYGEPHVSSAHPYTIDGPVVQDHLNDCGVGHILRTWTIYDHYGTAHYCTQQIKLRAHSSNIQVYWPDDYTTDECGAATDPQDLPHGFDYPVVHDPGDCSSIVMDHSDQTFVFDGTACIKILRTWTVADWCIYHPRDNPHQGIWNYIQIIKVRTSDPPQITCPDDITASSGDDCDRGYVSIPLATAYSNCAQNIHITNNSPYATSHGADASGYYPLGETWVKYKASDGCGHEVTCKIKVTVRDEVKPSPYCRHGLVTTLGWFEDGYYADVWADRFNINSYDNCTAPEDLQFEISPSHFTCDDLGRNRVFFTVTDESGNRNTCETYVIIQDNMGMCPDSAHAPLVITGEVNSPMNTPLHDVRIVLNNSSSMTHMTNEDGQYAFVDMMRGENYTVRPIKNDDILNGITSLDMIIMLKHILDIDKITDPYRMIAADVDHSGDISVLDLYKLRNVLLGIDTEFPNNYSWRFMDANYEFIDRENPLEEVIAQHYYIEDYDNPMTDLNFMGIKIGDVNGTVSNHIDNINERSNNIVDINIDSHKYNSGEELAVRLNVRDADEIEGFQFTLGYDVDQLDFAGINKSMNESADIHAYEIEKGVIRIQFLGDFLYNLKQIDWELLFLSKAEGDLHSALSLREDEINHEAYLTDSRLAEINLAYSRNLIGSSESLTDMDLFPNPAYDRLTLKFLADMDAEITTQLYDVNGRMVLSHEEMVRKGLNEIPLNLQEINNYSGILTYRIIYNGEVFGGQLMKLNE